MAARAAIFVLCVRFFLARARNVRDGAAEGELSARNGRRKGHPMNDADLTAITAELDAQTNRFERAMAELEALGDRAIHVATDVLDRLDAAYAAPRTQARASHVIRG